MWWLKFYKCFVPVHSTDPGTAPGRGQDSDVHGGGVRMAPIWAPQAAEALSFCHLGPGPGTPHPCRRQGLHCQPQMVHRQRSGYLCLLMHHETDGTKMGQKETADKQNWNRKCNPSRISVVLLLHGGELFGC